MLIATLREIGLTNRGILRDGGHYLVKLNKKIFIIAPVALIVVCSKTWMACREKTRLGCMEVHGPCENKIRSPVTP